MSKAITYALPLIPIAYYKAKKESPVTSLVLKHLLVAFIGLSVGALEVLSSIAVLWISSQVDPEKIETVAMYFVPIMSAMHTLICFAIVWLSSGEHVAMGTEGAFFGGLMAGLYVTIFIVLRIMGLPWSGMKKNSIVAAIYILCCMVYCLVKHAEFKNKKDKESKEPVYIALTVV